jgi:DMSO/TMAO reductase YedYZ molybdopterin-dependent catalytic subunit
MVDLTNGCRRPWRLPGCLGRGLASSFAGQVLPRKFGYPMKIRIPTKLGFKNPKFVVALSVTNNYPGGFWEDYGYNWFSGS